jgi:hypothetical protein
MHVIVTSALDFVTALIGDRALRSERNLTNNGKPHLAQINMPTIVCQIWASAGLA